MQDSKITRVKTLIFVAFILLFAMAASLFHQWTETGKTGVQLGNLVQTAQNGARNIKKMAAEQEALRALLQQYKDSQDALAQEVVGLKKELARTKDALRNRTIEDTIDLQTDYITLLSQKNDYMLDILTGLLDTPDENARKTPLFADFARQEWQDRVEQDARNSTASKAVRINGGRGHDTVKIDAAGDAQLDGMMLQNFETLDTANHLPNAVYIMAPALAALEKDTLTIKADPKIDTVELDGCLAWKERGEKNGMSRWIASDAAGKTRIVEMTAGVKANIQKNCDNRYILKHKIAPLKMLQKIGKNYPKLHIISEESGEVFGGIGAGLSGRDGQVFVVGTLPGSPAEKAGLQKGDRIIRVDDKDVETARDASDRIRGDIGTVVTIVYKPADIEESKTATLTRAAIDPDSARRPSP